MRLKIRPRSAPTWRGITTCCALVVIFGTASSFVRAQNEPRPAKSVWDGVYTETQANRGKLIYVQACGTCHAGDAAPALYGADFLKSFDGQTVAALFDKVSKTMPQDKPGSLTLPESADVVAYVLSLTFPSGKTELDREVESLEQLRFEAVSPKR
jgi:mono/diheme cytochrome c family protein